jgi:hypothetical protein
LAFIADTLQFRADTFDHHAVVDTKDATHVFTDDPCGLYLSYNSKHLRPEEAVVLRSSSSSGGGKRLTREAACEDVDLSPVFGAVELSNVSIEVGGREMMAEYALTERITVALKDVGPSHPLGCEVESSDAGEQ